MSSDLHERKDAGRALLDPAARVIVALDVDRDRMTPLLDALVETPTVKVGMEAFYREGNELVRAVRDRGHDVFLDLKLHDIPNTVARAAAAIARLGVRFLTIHAAGGPAMMQAAVASAGEVDPALRVLGVTLLTSLRGDECPGVWDDRTSPADKVRFLAAQAVRAGCHGVVASPNEAALVRELVGPLPLIVCPGVRPKGSPLGDQARAATPAEAVRSGADYLVVGRPITGAADPLHAWRAIVDELRLAPA